MTRARGVLTLLTAVLASSSVAVAAQEAQYVSPAGRKFHAQPDEKGAVAEARKKAEAEPGNAALWIALGDAQAAIWDHKAALAAYERAFALGPASGLLHQQRGHRALSIRRFDAARADLERAVELDPKLGGAWYYLGLVRYLAGDFDGAAAAYERNVALAESFAAGIGGVDWLYMAYRRGGRDAKAAALLERVTPDLKIEGNARLYFNRLLFYKGLKKEAELFEPAPGDIERTTLAYGVGNWHLYNGRPQEARAAFDAAIATSAWPALAFIAAERDLERLR